MEKFRIDGVKEAVTEWGKLNAQFEKSKIDLLDIVEVSQKASAQFKQIGTIKGFSSFSKSSVTNIKNLDKSTQGLTASQKALENATKRLQVAQSQEAIEIAEVRQRTLELNKVNKLNAQQSLGLVGAYKQLSQELVRQRAAAKNAAVEFGTQSKVFKSLAKDVRRTDAQLKSIDKTLGQGGRTVGLYGQALGGIGRNLLGALGVVGGLTAFVGVLRTSFNLIRNFQKQQATLAGVLGKTRSEITGLTDDAKRLGSQTAFTASEVSQLQESFARLGFSQQQILDSTEATLNGALALQSELGETAELVGGTLNAFGLEATESKRVIDILTSATQNSALNFQRLKESLSFVAPTARTLGLSLSETASLLGVLVDNNIKASRAGRLLSTSFLKLASEGKTLEQALDEINKAQDEGLSKLELAALSSRLFGKEAASLGVILANNRDRVNELTGTLNDAENAFDGAGAAAGLAEEQLDTLDGSLKLLNSAWEGLILSIESGEGSLGKFFKTAIDGLTSFLEGIRFFNRGVEQVTQDRLNTSLEAGVKVQKQLIEDRKEFNNQLSEGLKINTDEAFAEDLKIVEEQLASAQDELKKFVDETGATARDIGSGFRIDNVRNFLGIIGDDAEKVRELESTIQSLTGRQRALTQEIDGGNEAIELNTKANEENSASTRENSKALREAQKLRERLNKDALALSLFRKEQEIEAANDVANNENESYQNRLEALIRVQNLSNELIDIQTEAQIEKFKGREDAKTKALLEAEEDRAKIQDDINSRFDEINELGNVETNSELFDPETLEFAKEDFEQLAEVLKLNAQDLYDEFERIGINDLETFIKFNQDKIAESEKTAAEQRRILQDSFDALGNVLGISGSVFSDAFDLIDGRFETSAEKAQAFGNVVNGVLSGISQASNQRFQVALDNIEVQREKALESQELTAEQQEQINEQFDAKRRQVQRRQAESEKKQAILSAVVNTATGIIKAVSQSPLTFGLPFSAFVAGLGAAQIAAIKSQPIPEFAKGTMHAPQGIAKTDERGAELHTDRLGNIKDFGSDKGYRFKYLEKGDKIFTAEKTKDILSGNILDSAMLNGVYPKLDTPKKQVVYAGITEQEMENVMSKTLAKQPKHTMVWDKNGHRQYVQKGSTLIKRRNNPYGL